MATSGLTQTKSIATPALVSVGMESPYNTEDSTRSHDPKQKIKNLSLESVHDHYNLELEPNEKKSKFEKTTETLVSDSGMSLIERERLPDELDKTTSSWSMAKSLSDAINNQANKAQLTCIIQQESSKSRDSNSIPIQIKPISNDPKSAVSIDGDKAFKSLKVSMKDPMQIILKSHINEQQKLTSNLNRPIVINHSSFNNLITTEDNADKRCLLQDHTSQMVHSQSIVPATPIKAIKNLLELDRPQNLTCAIPSNSSRKTLNNQCPSKNQPDGKQLTSSQPTTSGPGVVSARLLDMGKRLLDAARNGQTDHVRQLVVNSGAPFTSDWLGTTALHLAAQNGHAEIAEILLRGGVNRDARTKMERTALHLAAQSGSLAVVELLLIHGSDINARDMLKMTPLHWAVERQHLDVVERLLIGGADIAIVSKFQLTPIDIAHNSDCYEIIELFKNCANKGNIDLNLYDNKFYGSHDMTDVDYQLMLADNESTSRTSILDIDEPCIDLVELEWSTFRFESDLSTRSNQEVRTDYKPCELQCLMKMVEELQRENEHLRRRLNLISDQNR